MDIAVAMSSRGPESCTRMCGRSLAGSKFPPLVEVRSHTWVLGTLMRGPPPTPEAPKATDRNSSECPARATARARPPFHDLLLIPNAKAKASASSRPWRRPAWSKSKTRSGTKSAPPSASFGRTEMVGQSQNQLRMMIPGPL
jgi:hypothetical protein